MQCLTRVGGLAWSHSPQGRVPDDISLAELQENYYLSIEVAATKLKVGLTTLKKLCRKFSIKRWPYRKVQQTQRLAALTAVRPLLYTRMNTHMNTGSQGQPRLPGRQRAAVPRRQHAAAGTAHRPRRATRVKTLVKPRPSRGGRHRQHSRGRSLPMTASQHDCMTRTEHRLDPRQGRHLRQQQRLTQPGQRIPQQHRSLAGSFCVFFNVVSCRHMRTGGARHAKDNGSRTAHRRYPRRHAGVRPGNGQLLHCAPRACSGLAA